MSEKQSMREPELTESTPGPEVTLHRGPGFQNNWEQAPISLTNFLGARPYYFNPKYLTSKAQEFAQELLASYGIVPQTNLIAPQDMKRGNNPIQKGDIVWAIGEKYDGNNTIPLSLRRKQISQLEDFWEKCKKDPSIALGLHLPNAEEIKFTKEERQKASEDLKRVLPMLYTSKDPCKILDVVKEILENGADINTIYEPTDVIVHFGKAVYTNPNNSYILTVPHVAAHYGNRKFLEFLDQKKVDWNKPDHNGNFPITEAFVFNNEEAIQFLFEKQVNLTHKNKFGKAPLDYYNPKNIRNDTLRAKLNQIKQQMKINDATQKFGPNHWDDVTYRKGNKRIHGHRINIQDFSDKEKERLRMQLTELEIPFKEDYATHPSETVPEGALNIRVSSPEGIRKLHAFWGWTHDEPRLQTVLEIIEQNNQNGTSNHKSAVANQTTVYIPKQDQLTL